MFDRGDLYRGKRKAIQCFTIYLLRGTLPTEGLSELSLTILRESPLRILVRKRTKDLSCLLSDLSSVVSHAADVLRLSGAASTSGGHRPGG